MYLCILNDIICSLIGCKYYDHVTYMNNIWVHHVSIHYFEKLMDGRCKKQKQFLRHVLNDSYSSFHIFEMFHKVYSSFMTLYFTLLLTSILL